MKKARVSHSDFKKKLLKKPNVRLAYDDMEEEFQLLSEMLHARKQAGMTQENLAKIMHTTPSSISRLESLGSKNQPSPSISTLKKYAHALGCKLSIKFVQKTVKDHT